MDQSKNQMGGSGGERDRPTIRIAHSPDADDQFMFYPLFNGKVDLQGIEVVDVQDDIQSLNQKALQGVYEVSAISFHAFPGLDDKYRLLSTGACFGDRYGPVVVSAKVLKPKQLLKVRIGIPGKLTTSFLALKLYEHQLAGEGKSGICYSEVAFDQIMEHIQSGKLDAGLIIHEGQLNYLEKGLHKVVDLGEWWHKETGLPLPLGAIVIRRDLPEDLQLKVGRLLQESIRYALDHKEECLAAALPFARGLDTERTAKFVSMYVNDMTIDWGRAGLKAIKSLLEHGYRDGILKRSVDMEEAVLDLRRAKPSDAAVAAAATLEAVTHTPSAQIAALPEIEASAATTLPVIEAAAGSDEEATIKEEDTAKIEGDVSEDKGPSEGSPF